jgi:hypothetical protein
VPLPPAGVAALEQLNGDGEHFFTIGKAKLQTARANWSRYLDTVFELAKVDDPQKQHVSASVQWRARRNGIGGIDGNVGIVESVTYRF